jgi:uncharacterized membrane protein
MLTHFMDAWGDPGMRHAMVVHFPIVLSVAGIPVAAAAAIIRDETRAMRWTALAIYAALALTGMLARGSGHDAHDAVYGSLSGEAQALLEEHNALGHRVWLFGAGVAVLLGASFARNRKIRLSSAWLAVAVAVVAAGWIASTADHGGRLVYDHGVGTHGGFTATTAGAPPAASDDARVTFFRDEIRPLLIDNCLRCHNPRRAERAGGFDQTSIAGWLAGGWSGPAVVPGHPDQSLVIQAVRGTDPDFQMPPGEAVLNDEQIAALERWIAEGVAWEAFEFQLPED